MMNKAKGPVWHKKPKDKGIVPKNLRALNKEATWCKSNADGWVYGHASFSLASHKVQFLGAFILKNSANEAKKMWLETSHFKDQIDYVAIDWKADNSRHRREMIKFMEKPQHKKLYRERSFKVEPMQGLVKDIFDLNRCWMRDNENNRWLFAAMGLTVQMH